MRFWYRFQCCRMILLSLYRFYYFMLTLHIKSYRMQVYGVCMWGAVRLWLHGSNQNRKISHLCIGILEQALLSLGKLFRLYNMHTIHTHVYRRKVKLHGFSVVLHKNYYSVGIVSGFNYLLLNYRKLLCLSFLCIEIDLFQLYNRF